MNGLFSNKVIDKQSTQEGKMACKYLM